MSQILPIATTRQTGPRHNTAPPGPAQNSHESGRAQAGAFRRAAS